MLLCPLWSGFLLPEILRHIAIRWAPGSGQMLVPLISDSLLLFVTHHLDAQIDCHIWQWQSQELSPGDGEWFIVLEKSEVPLLPIGQQIGIVADDLDHAEWASIQ